MKTLLFVLTILSPHAFAAVSLDHCLEDARQFASHDKPLKPLEECPGLVDGAKEKIEVKSADGKIRAFGYQNVVYVEVKNEDGVLVSRELLSGDQTELSDLKKLFLDAEGRRLFAIQQRAGKNELLVYDLDFLGNVTPLNVVSHPELFNTVKAVKVSSKERLEVENAKGKWFLNSDAETRATRSKRIPASVRAKP